MRSGGIIWRSCAGKIRRVEQGMSETYQPPFTMNEEITNLIVEIGEYVGRITTYDAMRPNPILRRENRIRTIHSSLAIEHNLLHLCWK